MKRADSDTDGADAGVSSDDKTAQVEDPEELPEPPQSDVACVPPVPGLEDTAVSPPKGSAQSSAAAAAQPITVYKAPVEMVLALLRSDVAAALASIIALMRNSLNLQNTELQYIA